MILCSYNSNILVRFDSFDEETNSSFTFSYSRTNDFDPEETAALLVSTSGTTGIPKVVVTTHKNYAIAGPYWW